MLGSLTVTIKHVVEAVVFLLVIYAFSQKWKEDHAVNKSMNYCIGLALLSGLLLVTMLKGYIDREVLDIVLRGFSILASLVLLAVVWIKNKWVKGKAIEVVSFFFMIIPSVDVFYHFVHLVRRSNGFLNSELLLQFFGGGLAFLIGYLLYKNTSDLTRKLPFIEIRFWGSLLLFLYLIRQSIGFFHMLFVLGYIAPTKIAVKFIAPFINTWQPLFFYVFILGLAAWMIHVALTLPRGKREDYENPAQKRKIVSKIIKSKRQIMSLFFLTSIILSMICINYYIENRPINISPAVPVVENDGIIKISKGQLEHGHLHRFSYVTPNGTEMKFLVIQKGEDVYGVGYDACNLCGVVGYYQDKDSVICIDCGVKINPATIGFPGGCNPIPLDHTVTDQFITIDQAELLKMEKVFE